MTTITELTFNSLTSDLEQFYGTEEWFRISPFTDLTMTSGIKYFADKCECHWLFQDFIAHKLYPIAKQQRDNFSIVRLEVTKTNMVKMSAFHDTDMPEYWQAKQKDYGKCIPIGTYEFYLIDNVVLLKSEY